MSHNTCLFTFSFLILIAPGIYCISEETGTEDPDVGGTAFPKKPENGLIDK